MSSEWSAIRMPQLVDGRLVEGVASGVTATFSQLRLKGSVKGEIGGPVTSLVITSLG